MVPGATLRQGRRWGRGGGQVPRAGSSKTCLGHPLSGPHLLGLSHNTFRVRLSETRWCIGTAAQSRLPADGEGARRPPGPEGGHTAEARPRPELSEVLQALEAGPASPRPWSACCPPPSPAPGTASLPCPHHVAPNSCPVPSLPPAPSGSLLRRGPGGR